MIQRNLCVLLIVVMQACGGGDTHRANNFNSVQDGVLSAQDFQSPPMDSRIHTWYHWLNGNISKTHITKDLESIKKVGLGGFTLFNVSEGIPFGGIEYYSEEWWEALVHTKKEAKRLGLTMGIMNGPGWSTSGGPWNTPENAMKEVVWKEQRISGPTTFEQQLGVPKPVLGLERDMKKDTVVNQRYYMPREDLKGHYQDIAVLAYPSTRGEKTDKPYRIKSWWHKAGFSKMARYQRDNRTADKEEVINPEQIIDITKYLDDSGLLKWEVPEGDWTILRVGFQPTGRSNHPAPVGGKGLEVDKMSRKAVDIHWRESVMKMVEAGEANQQDRAISYVLIDSYEAGHQNWTQGFEKQFVKQMGYDLTKYLPTIAGKVVGSVNESEEFLWDYRKVVSDMINQNYYKRFQELAHENGLLFAAEGYGNFGNTDDFATGEYIDIPANEFWANRHNHHGGITKLASSMAHVYGRRIVGSEAFTGSPNKIFETNPRDIKAQGDWFYSKGINQFWLHTFAHSPFDQTPGLGVGSYGSYFNRNNTWWDFAGGWFEYMARAQYVLQQGRSQSDILYFVGEDAPVDPEVKSKLLPSIPAGYDYDFCNLDVLQKATVKNGKIVLHSGQEYAVLVVKKSEHITFAALAELERLLSEGATAVAYQAIRTPSLKKSDENYEIYQRLIALLSTSHQGELYEGDAVKRALTEQGYQPDFEYTAQGDEDSVLEVHLLGDPVEYFHKRIGTSDVYFVSNQLDHPQYIEAIFRTQNKSLQLWYPESGAVVSAGFEITKDGRTSLNLDLEASESVFVVFGGTDEGSIIKVDEKDERIQEVLFEQPWEVSFQGNNAPNPIELKPIQDLSKHADPEVAHFSGTITYSNRIALTETDDLKKIELSLGEVHVAARVFVNDQMVGNLWKRPYELDLTEYVEIGKTNELKVEVANLWVNRIVGDQTLPEDSKWTDKTGSTAKGLGLLEVPDWVKNGQSSPTGRGAFVGWKWDHMKDKELMPSGIEGPVQLKLTKK
ncbi:MAG: glycosyl hydrolase [Cyclobacteriaceae bacterium]